MQTGQSVGHTVQLPQTSMTLLWFDAKWSVGRSLCACVKLQRHDPGSMPAGLVGRPLCACVKLQQHNCYGSMRHCVTPV